MRKALIFVVVFGLAKASTIINLPTQARGMPSTFAVGLGLMWVNTPSQDILQVDTTVVPTLTGVPSSATAPCNGPGSAIAVYTATKKLWVCIGVNQWASVQLQ